MAGAALEQATWFRRSLQVRSTATTANPLAAPPSLVDMTTAAAAGINIGHRRALTPDVGGVLMHPTASESSLMEVVKTGTPPLAGGTAGMHGSQELPGQTGMISCFSSVLAYRAAYVGRINSSAKRKVQGLFLSNGTPGLDNRLSTY